MSTATALAPAPRVSTGSAGLIPTTVRERLAAYLNEPGSESSWHDALQCRRDAAEQISHLSPAQKTGIALEHTREIMKLLAQAGLGDYPVEQEDVVRANSYRKQGWPGLLAAMTLVPAWQWPDAPALEDVPPWLWVDYAQYLFYVPQGFTAVGQAEVYAAHALRRLEELARVAAANRGSAAVRAALTVYLRVGNCIPLYFANGSLRRHFELRAQILTIAAGLRASESLLPLPRAGRKLRVAFVNRHFGSQTETYTTLPTFEQLDPERFEVHLFVHHASNSALEMYARNRVAGFQVLPEAIDDQVATLRAAELDVIVFGTNVTAVNNEVTQLALHRMAPLQVVNNSSCVTTGLREIDLYVSGDQTECADAPDHFTERLGLLPGPAHAFNYAADAQEPKLTWTREVLGVPQDAVLFVSAANFYKVIPEMQHTWAKLLAAVPGSRLLLHPFNPNWSSEYPIKRFSAEFDRVLASYGVDSNRLLLSTGKFPSRTDVKELMRLGDAYLDTFPFGGVNSLVDPLEAGVPVVAWEGQTFRSRMGAALLRSLDLEDCVASDEATYLRICTTLANDATRRGTIKQRIAAAFAHPPIFMDQLAASDAFGDLLELAFDRLVNDGADAFRRDREPLRITPVSNPGGTLMEAEILQGHGCYRESADKARSVLMGSPVSVKARHLYGRALVAQGRTSRAVDYLLGAVEHSDGDAPLWLDLARALLANRQRPQAVESLETCLRIDPKYVDGWLFMGGMARDGGNYEMLQQIIDLLRQLAPDDPRVAQFVSGNL